ncbi:MAG: hypothetical protein FWH02_05090 [Oscillospiraceae bacterium]|nr:hypothetical protein [Oscillospiraceae bacterium]
MISAKDREILRELAKRYSEIAANPVNKERFRRGKDANSLRHGRPLVWLDEIPWHEMDIGGELALRCEGAFPREMEQFFRRMLYRWKYIQADMVAEDAYYIEKAFDMTGIGIDVREDIIAADKNNHIVSHSYKDILETPEQVEALQMPVVTARPELDRARVDDASEVLDGILPVRLRGHGIYHAPWDIINRYRGVEPILIDMIERPEHLHALRRKFMEMGIAQYSQMEEQGLLDFDLSDIHCTPPYADELPARDYSGSVRMGDVWFRGMAQMFSTVSPAAHKEFDIDYMRPIMDRCGLAYYGCCEPLDNVLDILAAIPNMRKIGVSPWSDEARNAERLGGKFVYARKPNPAFAAGDFNEEAVRAETKKTVELCLKYGCAYEFVLKDISTVSYKPQNLISWVQTVEATIDSYYR